MSDELRGFCNRCGDCCDPVRTSFSPEAVLAMLIAEAQPGADQAQQTNAAFIPAHWTCLERHEDDPDPSSWWYEWSCDKFDRRTRTCTAYSSRPAVCQGFPWYDKPPAPSRHFEDVPCCSFAWDLPPADRGEGVRPLLPIVAVR